MTEGSLYRLATVDECRIAGQLQHSGMHWSWHDSALWYLSSDCSVRVPGCSNRSQVALKETCASCRFAEESQASRKYVGNASRNDAVPGVYFPVPKRPSFPLSLFPQRAG